MKELRKITREELDEILEKHKLLLDTYGMEDERADLSYTDLRGFNLTKVNLSHADLEGANLKCVDLSGANLIGTNLRGVNLGGADLSDANLRFADLIGASLRGTNLADVDLLRANLRYANLEGAELSGANLRDADLRYADLSDANLSDANLWLANLQNTDLTNVKNFPNIPLECPTEGSFIGWKHAGGYIIELEIPADAKRSSGTGIKCRCNKAKVLAIENVDGSSTNVTEVHSDHDPEFIYKVGETVIVDDFDDNRFNECAPGIHFFMNRDHACY